MKIWWIVVGILVGAGTGAAEDWWRVFGELKGGNFAGGHVDDEAELTEAQEAFLKQRAFDEWEVFEDELVRLEYPRHPELNFRVANEGGPVTVEGGVCTTVDNSFQRAYVLEVGEITYGVFLVTPAAWLDDGICLCGPMVHHVYNIENGCLVRFSLLPGGAVKKAQVLGDKLRLMAFEWTHLGCPRDVYERMVEAMTLRVPHRDAPDELRRRVIEVYGIEGKAGWLHPGMEVAAVEKLMGAPSGKDGATLAWTEPHGDYLTTMQVTMADGKLDAIEHEGTIRAENPIEGSLSWVDKHLQENSSGRGADPFGDAPGEAEEEGVEVTEQAVPVSRLTAALKELEPTLPQDRWAEFCMVLSELTDRHKVRDEELLAILRRRGEGLGWEFDVLQAYEVADLEHWVAQALDKMRASGPGPHHDLAALVSWLLARDAEAGREAAAKFLATGEEGWLEPMLGLIELLPSELDQKLIVRNLEAAARRRSSWWVIDTLEAVEAAELTHPHEVLELVKELPARDAGTAWENARLNALQDLERRVRGTKQT